MSKDVKAWTFTSGGYPKAMQLSTLRLPEGPLKPHEIRVRVKAASINPVDAQIMGFPLWPYLPAFLVPTYKGVGEDFAGVVESAGAQSGFKTGDEVFGVAPFVPGGTLQALIQIDVNQSVILPKPADWSWVGAGALSLVWLTAQTTLTYATPYVNKAAGKVAILGGSSGSGIYAVHIAKQRGWTVLATASGRNHNFVRSMGADSLVDYTTEDVPKKIKEFAPDAIIDFVGGSQCVGLAKRYVTVVGDKTSRTAMSGRNIYLWHPRMVARALRGRVGLGPSYTCINLEFNKSYLEEVLRLPKDKIIIDSTYGFDQVKEAFDKLVSGKVRGKVVIRVSE